MNYVSIDRRPRLRTAPAQARMGSSATPALKAHSWHVAVNEDWDISGLEFLHGGKPKVCLPLQVCHHRGTHGELECIGAQHVSSLVSGHV